MQLHDHVGQWAERFDLCYALNYPAYGGRGVALCFSDTRSMLLRYPFGHVGLRDGTGNMDFMEQLVMIIVTLVAPPQLHTSNIIRLIKTGNERYTLLQRP